MAISVDAEVHAKILTAVEAQDTSISAWMTEAARHALRMRDGLAAIAEWEAEHGEITEEELEAARVRLTPTKRHRASRAQKTSK